MKCLTMECIKEYTLKNPVPTAILPVGAVEAHGPHLPLTTDSIIAEAIAEKVGEEIGAIVLPVLSYGALWSTRSFPGSLWIEPHLLEEIVYQIGRALSRNGLRLFVVINGHVGNSGALREGLRKLLDDNVGLDVMLFNPDVIKKVAVNYVESKFWHPEYFHADEIETSLLLYLRPDLVDMSKAKTFYPESPPNYYPYIFVPWDKLTPIAVIGDPLKATREKGEKIFLESCRLISSLIRERISHLLKERREAS